MRSISCVVFFAFAALLSVPTYGSSGAVRHAKLMLSLVETTAPANVQQVTVEIRTGDEVRQVTAPLPGRLAIELPQGIAYAQVISDAYWSGSRAFEIASDDQELSVDVHPAGVVTGAVTLDDGKQTLPAAQAIFIAHNRATPWSKSTVIPCDVTKLQWSCVVPAGLHDLRLRVPGYVSAYYAKTAVTAGKRLDVGVAKLQRGASLVGTVTVDRAPRGARPTVTLEPKRMATYDDERTAFRAETTYADERGFFHFDGVAPGMYSVRATLPGYASARGSAQVVEGRESEMADALFVERARRLELSVEPPRDFSGEPWNITLLSERPGAFRENITQSAAGQDGQFSWQGARGTYDIQVRSADGKVWREDVVVLDRDPSRAHLVITPRRIHGTVRLAGEPLRAKLAFHQRYGPTAESNDEGEFSGLVPPGKKNAWLVYVTSEREGVSRELTVRAPERDDDPLPIELPAARISGVIVDEQGNGVENAIITVEANQRQKPLRTEVRSGPGGVFRAAALKADTYLLSAHAGAGESDTVSVTLADEEDRRMELVVHPWNTVEGTVSSGYGPIAGAEIYIEPLRGTFRKTMYYTDATGSFKMTVPPGTESFDIAVSAPGFARSFFRTPYRRGRKLNLRVDQTGGTLILDVPKSSELPLTTWTYLVRGEARMMLGLAQRWGVVRTPSGEDRYTLEVPQMEVGPYMFCATQAGGIPNTNPIDPKRCVSGVLAPYGRLTLRLDQ